MAKKTETKTEATKKQRTLTGVVIKKSSANTIKVRVERKESHPLYGKVVATHINYLVDCSDAEFEAVEIGQAVVIGEVAPVSKRKFWKLLSTEVAE